MDGCAAHPGALNTLSSKMLQIRRGRKRMGITQSKIPAVRDTTSRFPLRSRSTGALTTYGGRLGGDCVHDESDKISSNVFMEMEHIDCKNMECELSDVESGRKSLTGVTVVCNEHMCHTFIWLLASVERVVSQRCRALVNGNGTQDVEPKNGSIV
ncbi:hypothetical protein ACLB2K_007745 [Fragaria x ananassa]